MKTLTDISSYTDYVHKLLDLFAEETPEEIVEQKEIKYPYTQKMIF